MPGLTGLELAQRIQRHALPIEGGHRHHVRAHRLPAPRARCRRLRLSAEGRAGRRPGRSIAQGASRRPRDRSAARGRGLDRRRSAQRPRTPGAAPGRRRPARRARSQRRSISRTARCATICRKRSASSASATASRPTVSRGRKGGCRSAPGRDAFSHPYESDRAQVRSYNVTAGSASSASRTPRAIPAPRRRRACPDGRCRSRRTRRDVPTSAAPARSVPGTARR